LTRVETRTKPASNNSEATMPVTIEKVRAVTGPGYPPCFEYYVYQGDKLVRVCPSLGMAQEVAAGL
jgi:hypothetical protein